MAVPYAALVGLALDASSGIGNNISKAYRGGHPDRDRDNERINQQYLDAVARKYGYGVNYAGEMPVGGPAGNKPLLGNQAGLGAAIQALGGIGGGDSSGPTAEDIQKSDFFKHSGDYGAESAAELAGGGGAGGGSDPSVIADNGFEDADWYKNAGREPIDLLRRRWHPDDEKDPWGRL